MSSGQPEILAKGKFAEKIGLSAGRISQYIASGQISTGALVGEGRAAKINVELAMADLESSLDLSQRLGNGANTKINPTPLKSSSKVFVEQPQLPVDKGDQPLRQFTTQELYSQEKLKTARANNRRLKEQELERRGMYTLTSTVEQAIAQNVNLMVRTFEGGLVEMANDLAEKFGLPNRDVIHALKKSFHMFRDNSSNAAKERAASVEPSVEDNTGIDGLHEDTQGEA